MEELAREVPALADGWDQPGRRVPYAQMQYLWEYVHRRVGDDRFGLSVGERLRLGSYHALGYALQHCSTLRDALPLVERYHRLASEASHVGVTIGSDTAALYHQPVVFMGPSAVQQVEAVLAGAVTAAMLLTDQHVRPVRVAFAHSCTGSARERCEEFFGCPVDFGSDRTSIEFLEAQLDTPIPYADTSLRSIQVAYADELLGKLEAPPTASLVLSFLRDCDLSRASIGDASQALQISRRSLQRALASEGTSWRSLLDSIRHETALRLLSDGNQALSQVTSQLGYSDPASFSRSFRRWEGMPPGQWVRAKLWDG